MNVDLILLIVGGVLAVSVVTALVASNAGVPALVVFLVFGMLLGRDGLGHINFINVELAQFVGTLGLVAILFEGGLSTSRRRLREAFIPAVMLSTFGVAITAFLAGLVAHFLLGLHWLPSMLLGAVVSSTDAAAVFATLRFTRIRRRLARILEAETGGNDPMAIALTVGFISWIQQPTYHLGNLILLLVEQLGIGLIFGLILGRLATYIFSHLPRSIGAFSPVASVAAALLAYGLTSVFGGSGFLTVYIVGLAIGSTPSRYRGQLTLFHDGLAFLAQVSMFIIMGLFVVPHTLLPVLLPSVVLALLLVIVIRPFAVWLSLSFSGLNLNERALLGWAGLRGAVPIVLGTYVLSAGIPNGEFIFNVVFFVVLISTVIQGTTLNWMAERLGVVDHIPAEKLKEYADAIEQIFFHVAPQHAIVGARVNEVGLPSKVPIVGIRRRSKPVIVTPETILKVGDQLTIEAPYSLHPEVEDVFMRWRRRV